MALPEPSPPPPPPGVLGLAGVDVNSDTNLDLVTTSANNISILTGDGAGAFAAPSIFNPGPFSNAFVAACQDHPMVVGGVELFGHDGQRGFPQTISLNSLGGSTLSVGDVNNDGHLDVLAAGQAGNLEILLGHGNATFSRVLYFTLGGNFASRSLLLKDLDGNGLLDVAPSPIAGQLTTLLLHRQPPPMTLFQVNQPGASQRNCISSGQCQG